MSWVPIDVFSTDANDLKFKLYLQKNYVKIYLTCAELQHISCETYASIVDFLLRLPLLSLMDVQRANPEVTALTVHTVVTHLTRYFSAAPVGRVGASPTTRWGGAGDG